MEPTLEQIEAIRHGAVCRREVCREKYKSALSALLSAYWERGREIERLEAEIGRRGSPPPEGSWTQRLRQAERERDEARAELGRVKSDLVVARAAEAINLNAAKARKLDLQESQAREAKLREDARAACPNPCTCGSGRWPCHVDGDAACELVLSIVASIGPARSKEEPRG